MLLAKVSLSDQPRHVPRPSCDNTASYLLTIDRNPMGR